MFYFNFIVSATAKTASMATTDSNCIQMDNARTQNSQNKFVVCHKQTLRIMQSYLVIIMFIVQL